MIIILKPHTTEAEIALVVKKIESFGLAAHISKGTERTIIGAIGDERALQEGPLEAFPFVEQVLPILKPYKLASREFKPDGSIVNVDGVLVGGRRVVVMAGPCAVESREGLLQIAQYVKTGGGHILRGGAYKPRTSPYTFQGLGEEGLAYLAEAKQATGLPIATELMDSRDADAVYQYADLIQIGARNMQNFKLLTEVGSRRKPVLLKRGSSSTVKELLLAAEYILSEGNYDVILCERGIRTFEDATRNTLDLSAVPLIKRLSHLPVVVDPSHGTGKWHLVSPMALAAIAAGADGIMVEVHPHPEEALSDGPQALVPSTFETLMNDLNRVAQAVGRSL
ncbi:MAG: 3-deoxy-7-phosphoheptulonate synthase [Candidatus Methylomirabilis oxygeniifera]|uniref:Phospho-2-dehydro-3-deoxyheptonate aldolase (Phospho-2-keto-3-deoxyheptonate aldolase) (DAHP synthetase) (3-deoxy-D-arabino-heptulosonate 7-phosphate synthase) n=1 Tax=Methylomirabilis oxygeniifera TaxID=671143 RepID=D5MET5_METO1|nr:MAG: 3-deoxy-7-phosphoheptulonate synthase [Candidatus Methylomirabilis oxyfera]CBE68264.1 Phospho-2-dehydro-3-deoxyheptonate aldolase (Phospho-2-keto-3-deoxyheptonate aldolase) (DAHP synthetase) (3-deoxy-D-arabino-heptulosonate 7-phosphate synthase) [Candidatus Methylomirabilis oxyfera]